MTALASVSALLPGWTRLGSSNRRSPMGILRRELSVSMLSNVVAPRGSHPDQVWIVQHGHVPNLIINDCYFDSSSFNESAFL